MTKHTRIVHLGFDMGISPIGDTSSVPDLELTPNSESDRLTCLHLVSGPDAATGNVETHVYVLNEEYRQLLIKGLTGGLVLPNLNGAH